MVNAYGKWFSLLFSFTIYHLNKNLKLLLSGHYFFSTNGGTAFVGTVILFLM